MPILTLTATSLPHMADDDDAMPSEVLSFHVVCSGDSDWFQVVEVTLLMGQRGIVLSCTCDPKYA